MKQIAWTVERDNRDDFVLLWWPRGDNYCLRKQVALRSTNFIDAVTEAKYILNIEYVA
jgi:hypothetical protein